MITNVAIVNVFVQDQQSALEFYTDILGFRLQDDVTLDHGFRWCTVGHPNQPELLLSLVEFGPPLPPELAESLRSAQRAGGWRGLGFNVDDCWQTFRDLTAQGVEFVQEPSARPYGTEAVCRDNSGNWIVLIELAAPSGANPANAANSAISPDAANAAKSAISPDAPNGVS